jgi:hypothetical protein
VALLFIILYASPGRDFSLALPSPAPENLTKIQLATPEGSAGKEEGRVFELKFLAGLAGI